jgi:putative transposase
MNCPSCMVTTTKKRTKKTKLGYTTFFCPRCRCTFHERTGTPFNYLEFPTDIVLLAVFWRLRYKLNLRDIAEMFLERGFTFTHEAIRDWEARFAPLISDKLRTTRRGQAGKSWYVDETYIKVHGKWCYQNTYLNNELEQDHRGIKQRYYPMRGFGTFEAAARFCCALDELRNYFRLRHTTGGWVSLPEQRQAFRQRLAVLQAFIQAA